MIPNYKGEDRKNGGFTHAIFHESPKVHDPVHHPSHYTWLPGGLEVIDVTENFNFCLGNALKYIMRAGHKDDPIQDLRKAIWYLDREIKRREENTRG